MSAVIRTIGADLPVEEAGPIYAHEHVIIDTPLIEATMPHIHLHSVEEGKAEVQECIAAGIRLMVDAMPSASGRVPEKLVRISIVTGMRMVAVTGLHTAKYYDDVPWTRTESPERLAARFVADVEEGIDEHDYRGDSIERTLARAGVIKAAALQEALTDRDQRVFEAAAIAHRQTGAPILTHTEGGLGGLVQIEFLLSHGVAPDCIAVSHTDKLDDLGYHRAMLETGAFLCYDQGIRTPEKTAILVNEMSAAGFDGQIVLGTDGARRSLWSTLGGAPGLAWLYSGFPALLDGPRAPYFDGNPARWLTMRVKV